jgi:uncharacterized protein YggE
VSHRTITVPGVGTTSAAPDLLTADLEAWSEGPSAGEVLTETNRHAAALLTALAELGVAPADVATTSVHVGPTWDREGHPSGYRASNGVRVVLRDLATAGGHLDALARLLGDHVQLGGVSLGLADDASVRSAARAAAMADARARADELAAAVGAAVGEVRRIVEGGGSGPVPIARAFAADASIPLAGGATEVTVAVEVEFDLEAPMP